MGYIRFPRVLVLCEMQSILSRIWTSVVVPISYDDNHYITGTSCVKIYGLDSYCFLCYMGSWWPGKKIWNVGSRSGGTNSWIPGHTILGYLGKYCNCYLMLLILNSDWIFLTSSSSSSSLCSSSSFPFSFFPLSSLSLSLSLLPSYSYPLSLPLLSSLCFPSSALSSFFFCPFPALCYIPPHTSTLSFPPPLLPPFPLYPSFFPLTSPPTSRSLTKTIFSNDQNTNSLSFLILFLICFSSLSLSFSSFFFFKSFFINLVIH